MSDSEIESTLDSSPPDVSTLKAPSTPFPRPMKRSSPVVTTEQPYRRQLAVTVNIKPNKLINRKRWKLYTADKQQQLLSRFESFSRKDIPDLKLLKIVYESCPVQKQIHFHALYEGYQFHQKLIKDWWDEKVDGNDLNTKIPWRHIDVQEVYCLEGWIEYISKGETQR